MNKLLILLCILLHTSAQAQTQTFKSNNTKTQLLELYSSQGCSSCPPAERWVSKLVNHTGLWTQFIPLVFHVDYWNYLGWKDPFANKKYSQRQRTYHSQNAINSVYTPGFILDGQEWRGLYHGNKLIPSSDSAGVLSAKLTGKNLQVSYEHAIPLRLNIVLLGFGIETNIKGGENGGHTFIEDFVVLNQQSLYSENGQWILPVTLDSKFNAKRYALAIWVNSGINLQPLQATGDWIDMK